MSDQLGITFLTKALLGVIKWLIGLSITLILVIVTLVVYIARQT